MVKAIMDRVFIRLKKKKEKTDGGLLLTDGADVSRTIGVVESVGEKVTSVQVGDKVLFHQFDELPTYDADVVVVREYSLLGILNDDK